MDDIKANDMNDKPKSLRAVACAIAASACMLFSAPSQSAAFQVEFDPPFELYGIATFDLSAPCLANNGTFSGAAALIPLTTTGCTIELLNAHISIFGNGGPYVDYVSAIPIPLPIVYLSDLIVANHDLAGLGTYPLLPFFLMEANPPAPLLPLASFSTHPCYAQLGFTATGGVSFTGCIDGQLQPALAGDIISITRVPEPATLALVLGAGLAGWLNRRRKRAA